jgi:DNA-binding response OmpR family regulator
VVTTSSLESDRAEAIAAGASDYIQKPLALNQFSKDLESLLQHWLPN